MARKRDRLQRKGTEGGNRGSRTEQKGNDQREEAWVEEGVKEGNDCEKEIAEYRGEGKMKNKLV
jgi:hypothetical protein